jgi:hypothetical protein
MVLAEFDLAVDYGQIFAFRPSVARPVVVWTDEHVAQGFAWSPSAMGFGVPDHDGESLVQVNMAPITRLTCRQATITSSLRRYRETLPEITIIRSCSSSSSEPIHTRISRSLSKAEN